MKEGFAALNCAIRGHLYPTQLQPARLAKVLLMIACCTAALAQTSFYSSNDINLSSYPNGGLIRSEFFDGTPDNAAAYRVVYRSLPKTAGNHKD
jgi:hypothetical protein